MFGAKFVELVEPAGPVVARRCAQGQVLDADHVTVEINTVFQQLTSVLAKIEPEKLNETLGAISGALERPRREARPDADRLRPLPGQARTRACRNLSHDLEVAPAVLNAYADAAPDLVDTVDNATQISDTIVDEQQNLDAFLVSAIGLADIGNDVVGSNRQALTDVLRMLVPTTDLPNEYHADAELRHRRPRPVRRSRRRCQSPASMVIGQLHARRRALPLPAGPAEGRRQRAVRSAISAARRADQQPPAVRGRRHRRQPVRSTETRASC